MQDCWNQEPNQRPTFGVILRRLEDMKRYQDIEIHNNAHSDQS